MSHYNEEMTLAELLADPAYQDRNADLTTEDFRALLAEEITPEDIHYRRERIKWAAEAAEREARQLAAAKAKMSHYDNCHTRSLLRKFRDMRTDIRNGYGDEVEFRTMRLVLETREHVECSKQGGKAMRRAAAILNRGQGKSKNRGGGKR
jgi:hypothetical protein